MLRRLKPLGATSEELLEIYDKQIRCITEFASPVWTSRLAKDEVNQIERIQILEEKYASYEKALKLFKKKLIGFKEDGS